MNDNRIEIPKYLKEYASQLQAWQEARNAPMPHPDVPKIPPDDTVTMPMRDGVRLFTEIFFPEYLEGGVPTILIRTPYPDATFPFSEWQIELFREAGYAVAIQSCRGTWKSEGQFRFFQNEPEDGYDCVEWLAEQPWSNGKIGMSGYSYSASTQWLAARLKPPHLTCIAPQSPGAMFFYETPFIGGVFYKWHLLTWPRFVVKHSRDEIGLDFGLSGSIKDAALQRAINQSSNKDALTDWHEGHTGLAEALCEPLEHPTFDDWWKRIMLTPQSAKSIDIPVFAITGFYDGDQAGCLYNWQLVEANELFSSTRRHLLVGAWQHHQMMTGKTDPMGEVRFGPNADLSLPKAVLRFFNAYMKGDRSELEKLPQRCRLYTSGTNIWHEVSQYPPKEAVDTPLYLSSDGHANSLYGDGRLIFEVPGSEPTDKLVADWELPVPGVAAGIDGRENETRHDVLVYTSFALDQDFTVLGPVRAMIHLVTDVPDCDVVMRIEDVRPDGAAINMTGQFGFGAFRARYREGFDREVLLEPGQPALLPFHVCHMGHTFKRGHRIRVVITATVGNQLEPNHHTGEPLLAAVKRLKAIEQIFHDSTRPSHVILPVFKG